MNILHIFLILTIHWIADFILQTDKQAKGKSSNWMDLLSHTGVYSAFWIVLYLLSVLDFYSTLSFIGITFVFHTITDFFTSRINSGLWKANKTHWFFVSVGFDQLLHYFQLLTTYYILTY